MQLSFAVQYSLRGIVMQIDCVLQCIACEFLLVC